MTRARDLAKGTFSGDLTVDTNTLVVDSVNNRVGVGTANPTEEIHGYSSGGDFSLKLESASATGTAYTYYKNADRQWATGIRGSVGDSYQIIDSTADTARLVIDTAGRVTMPYQPAFQVKKIASQINITVGADVTVLWETEVFDAGSDFASNTFTAPVTGKYQLNVHLLVEQVDTASDYYQLKLTTSNRLYYDTVDPGMSSAAIYSYLTLNNSVLADMDEGDTAIVMIRQATGTSQSDLNGTTCVFSGYLVA